LVHDQNHPLKQRRLEWGTRPPPELKKTHVEQLAPAVAQKDQKHGFFSKVGAFFATLFH
jgi:hypothetical protein